MFKEYDVIVVGAGHAGCEAAHAAATMGSKVMLVTMNMMTSRPPMHMESSPLRMESAPREGPTVRSSRTLTGAGRAPARSTIARSRASSVVNRPVIRA